MSVPFKHYWVAEIESPAMPHCPSVDGIGLGTVEIRTPKSAVGTVGKDCGDAVYYKYTPSCVLRSGKGSSNGVSEQNKYRPWPGHITGKVHTTESQDSSSLLQTLALLPRDLSSHLPTMFFIRSQSGRMVDSPCRTSLCSTYYCRL